MSFVAFPSGDNITGNMTAMPGNNWTNTSTYNCVGIHLLPFHGFEILGLCVIYLALVAMYAVTFMDVALKQLLPNKFLDAEVMKRVQKLQADFPGIGGHDGPPAQIATATAPEEKQLLGSKDSTDSWDPVVKVKDAEGAQGSVKYDQVVSMEPYVASCCVDEDMTFQLANNNAYGTVSEYCSSTVRGYAMLATMLPMCGTFLGFAWCHNAMINPVGTNYARYASLLSYFLIFLTGTIMCGPASNTVHRNRNIILWTSIKTSNPLIDWHTRGVIGFCLIPMLANLWQVVFHLTENEKGMLYGIIFQFLGLGVFVVPQLLQKKKKITNVQASQIEIVGEIIAVMASLMSFIQVETFSTAACAQMPTTYGYTIIATILGTLGTLTLKQYVGVPLGPYTNGPSVVLLNQGTPVATSGPVPILNYDRSAMILPMVQPAH